MVAVDMAEEAGQWLCTVRPLAKEINYFTDEQRAIRVLGLGNLLATRGNSYTIPLNVDMMSNGAGRLSQRSHR